ncbi:hypothetical protein AB0J14_27265 [Micromonospora arborensis]|uniref:WXG100-like domain-containing protein n=1 Tax=Micromonospora arborensis TaxID=2116518 RepID=UPI0033EFFBF6
MGIDLPGELADLLNELGYTWPKADETQLFELAQEWIGLGDRLAPMAHEASGLVATLTAGNQGAAVEAFQAKWHADKSAANVLTRGATGATVLGGALLVCAAVVLALKINVIVQLTILLIQIIQAVATAAPTFGASLLEIPVFKKLTDILINILVDQAIGQILG